MKTINDSFLFYANFVFLCKSYVKKITYKHFKNLKCRKNLGLSAEYEVRPRHEKNVPFVNGKDDGQNQVLRHVGRRIRRNHLRNMPKNEKKNSLRHQQPSPTALPLPVACALTQFMKGNTYQFAIRAQDLHTCVGPASLNRFLSKKFLNMPENSLKFLKMTKCFE